MIGCGRLGVWANGIGIGFQGVRGMIGTRNTRIKEGPEFLLRNLGLNFRFFKLGYFGDRTCVLDVFVHTVGPAMKRTRRAILRGTLVFS